MMMMMMMNYSCQKNSNRSRRANCRERRRDPPRTAPAWTPRTAPTRPRGSCRAMGGWTASDAAMMMMAIDDYHCCYF